MSNKRKGQIISSLIILAATLISSLIIHQNDSATKPEQISLNTLKIESWTLNKYSNSMNYPFVNSIETRGTYSNNKKTIDINHFRYNNNINETDLFDYRNNDIPESWKIYEKMSFFSNDKTINGTLYTISNDKSLRLLLTLKRIGKTYTNSSLYSKLVKLNAWMNREKISSSTMISILCDIDCTKEKLTINNFVNSNKDEILKLN